MTKWEDLPKEVLDVMRALGNFGPTIREEESMVKGYTLDPDSGECSKEYLDANDLHEIAIACDHVANWLIERKNNKEKVL